MATQSEAQLEENLTGSNRAMKLGLSGLSPTQDLIFMTPFSNAYDAT